MKKPLRKWARGAPPAKIKALALTVSLPGGQVQEVKEYAAKTGRKVSAVVQAALVNYLLRAK